MNYKLKGLPTRELKPSVYQYAREQKRRYTGSIEEPLPEGCSLRDPKTMSLVFRSMN